MPYPIARINANLDSIYPNTGNIGHFCLLEQFFTTTNLGITIDPATDTITTNVPHRMVTGAKVRLDSNSGSTYVEPLYADQDYLVYVVSATQIKLAEGLQALEAEDYVNIIGAGSGNRSITEQPITEESPLEVMVSHEFKTSVNPGYSRKAILNVGAANEGKKLVSWSMSLAVSEPQIIYGYVLFLKGSAATPGDTTGLVEHLSLNLFPVTINPGETAFFAMELGFRNFLLV